MNYISRLSREESQVCKFLGVFFSADAKFVTDSLEEIYSETGVDVVTNKLRTSYKISNNQRLIIVYEHGKNKDPKREKAVLYKILITSELFSKIPDVYFDYTSIVVSEFFNEYRNHTFVNFYDFNSIDILSKTLVSYMLATSSFRKENIYSWVEKLEKLASTTFEGNYFTTGFILTRRMGKILNKKSEDYECLKFFDSFPIFDFENDYKRYWYLADGINNFFICDKEDKLSYILTIKKKEEFYKRFFLESFISGQDIVFRSRGNGELSIINKNQIEIIKRENEWKIRSLDSFIEFFKKSCEINEEVAKSFGYYILQCSQNHRSSIFFIPYKKSTNIIIESTISQKNDMQSNNINITNPDYEELLFRIFSSDGANIIDRNGRLLYCGAIVDMEITSKKGMVGTGESAAKSLGKYGVCVKVSQDGKIKIFKNNKKFLF